MTILDRLPASYLDESQPELRQASIAIYSPVQEEINSIQNKINQFISDWINPNTALEENLDNYLRLQLNFGAFWRKDWSIAAKRWLCKHYRWVWGAASRVDGCDRPNYTRAGIERLFLVFELNARFKRVGDFLLGSSSVNVDSLGGQPLSLTIECASTYQPYSMEFQTLEMIRRTFISCTLDVQIQRIL